MQSSELERIYLQNADLVYKYLLSLCHDRYLAEDLTSQTFLEAFRCYSRYDRSCKLSVWLCSIAKHLYYRQLAKTAHESAFDELDRSDEPSVVSAEETAIQNDSIRRLNERIDALVEPMRSIVKLRAVEERSFSEIGKQLGISEIAARVGYFRAKNILKKEEEK